MIINQNVGAILDADFFNDGEWPCPINSVFDGNQPCEIVIERGFSTCGLVAGHQCGIDGMNTIFVISMNNHGEVSLRKLNERAPVEKEAVLAILYTLYEVTNRAHIEKYFRGKSYRFIGINKECPSYFVETIEGEEDHFPSRKFLYALSPAETIMDFQDVFIGDLLEFWLKKGYLSATGAGTKGWTYDLKLNFFCWNTESNICECDWTEFTPRNPFEENGWTFLGELRNHPNTIDELNPIVYID